MGVHSGPKSLVQLPSLLGLGIRDSGAALPPPVGGTIALSSQSRYPWTTRTGERCWESKENPCLVASFSAGRSPPGAPQRAPDASQTRCNEHAQRLPPFTNSWGPRRAPGPACHARSRTRLRFACTGGETVTSGPVLGRRGRRRCAARTGRGGPASVSAAAAAGAEQPVSPTAACPPPPRTMAGSSSLEAVRRKIRSLQEQADAAEERAGSLQRELDYERKLRETVRDPPITHPPTRRRPLPSRPHTVPQGPREPN